MVGIIGRYIKDHRQNLGLSQKELGQKLSPPVTTQFISNIERSITPIPPHHVATLCVLLKMNPSEFAAMMEKEYSLKLSKKMGDLSPPSETQNDPSQADAGIIRVHPADLDFFKSLYLAYVQSDSQAKKTFQTVAENMLPFLKK